jgi:putative membrane protein
VNDNRPRVRRFFDDDGKAALSRAVVAFEAATAVELVVAVRPRSSDYPGPGILVGSACALVTTAFLLYGEPEFELHWFLLLPALVGLITGYAADTPALQWLLTGAATREARALQAARATFVEKGVADTRGRTGALLYVSLIERVALVITDIGVRQAVPATAWDPAALALTGAVARGARAVDLVAPLAALATVASKYLPRAADDFNELPDEVST